MKARHVPITSVSIDPEIRRMRDIVAKKASERITLIDENSEEVALYLWESQYIRSMTAFSFEFAQTLLGSKCLSATRVGDNQIIITYQTDFCRDENFQQKESPVKTVTISEREWNLVISYLFNYVKIDLWDEHISCYSSKAYHSDGSIFRQVPVCDGYSWQVTVCGERRIHNYSGMCRVPENWTDFERLIRALEAKVEEPLVDLSNYFVESVH